MKQMIALLTLLSSMTAFASYNVCEVKLRNDNMKNLECSNKSDPTPDAVVAAVHLFNKSQNKKLAIISQFETAGYELKSSSNFIKNYDDAIETSLIFIRKNAPSLND